MPQTLEVDGQVWDFSRRTYIMGIVNVTPDSFSDGGLFADADAAVAQGRALAAAGADILDIGGESTRPGAEEVSVEEEDRRVLPVIERLAQEVSIPISIDTYKAPVAEAALDAGAAMINDVSALRLDPGMAPLAAERDVPVVLMHMQGVPRDMQKNPRYDEVVTDICRFFEERMVAAEAAGIARERIILDPGVGFGKTLKHNLEILARLEEFGRLGRPILLGASRKSFIGAILDLPVEERFAGTLGACLWGLSRGVQILRVHDVGGVVQAVRVFEAIRHYEEY